MTPSISTIKLYAPICGGAFVAATIQHTLLKKMTKKTQDQYTQAMHISLVREHLFWLDAVSSAPSHFVTTYAYHKMQGHRVSCLNLLPRTLRLTMFTLASRPWIEIAVVWFYREKEAEQAETVSYLYWLSNFVIALSNLYFLSDAILSSR